MKRWYPAPRHIPGLPRIPSAIWGEEEPIVTDDEGYVLRTFFGSPIRIAPEVEEWCMSKLKGVLGE